MNKLGLLTTLCCFTIFTTAVYAGEKSPPLIVAHRGLLLHAPENTLSNFRACLELRIGFEFDVQQTRDGQLVCIHDDSVERTTNGKGKVADLTLEEIRRLDAGSWFDHQFAGEKVPTVEEVFRLLGEYRQHNILVAVDLKARGVETAVVRLAEKYQVLPRLLFIGRTIGETAVRQQLHKASALAKTAAVANTSDEFAAALPATEADWVYVRFLATAEQVASARQAGKSVFIAGPTVSGREMQNWTQAAKVGIAGILTDHALELRTLLRSK